MKITFAFPSKIPSTWIFWGTLGLAFGQLVTGTHPVYVLLIALFVIFSGLTVNALGGFSTVNGFCIAMLALKVTIISQVAKVFFWQPGDSFLGAPLTTAAVLLVGMISVYGAALFVRLFPIRQKLLQPMLDRDQLFAATLLFYAIGLASIVYMKLFGFDEAGTPNVGGVMGLARLLTRVLPLSVVTGTAYVLVASGRRKSFGVMVLIPLLTCVLYGLLQTGKRFMYEPLLYYVLTCVAFRYSFKTKHLGVLFASALFAVTVFFPFAQAGRSETRSTSASENVGSTFAFVKKFFSASGQITSDLDEQTLRYSDRLLYYGRPAGILDRFALIQMVDELVCATLEQGASGWETITHGFKMLLPRVIYPDKPTNGSGNFLGRKAGVLRNPRDEATQVSFGFMADAFSAFSWVGILIIPFVLTLCFFLVHKKLVGTVQHNIWAIYLFGLLQHDFVEQSVAGHILLMTYGTGFVLSLYWVSSKSFLSFFWRRKRAPHPGLGMPMRVYRGNEIRPI